MKFTEMELADYIINGLTAQGIDTAMEIQELTLPTIKNGSDVIGLSETGSGKTYAYGIAALERIDMSVSGVQILIICPTRELATQVGGDLRKLSSYTDNISIATIFGGANIDRQMQSLRRGAKIVVGTPGRIMDHLRRKTLKLHNLKMVVLDEADEMLDMGFKPDIETILKSTPSQRQTVMFSATMPNEIVKLTKQFMREPIMIKSQNHGEKHEHIVQYYVNCNKLDKAETLIKIYQELKPTISIVFCNTKKMTAELTEFLQAKGLPAVCLHGDMYQRERMRAMDGFKKNTGGGILVATDVAARGIDIKDVDVVINFDIPNNEDQYTHRIGRTGRAGKGGVAVTIINSKQLSKVFWELCGKKDSSVSEYLGISTADWTQNTNSKKPQTRTDSKKNQPKASGLEKKQASLSVLERKPSFNKAKSSQSNSDDHYKSNNQHQAASFEKTENKINKKRANGTNTEKFKPPTSKDKADNKAKNTKYSATDYKRQKKTSYTKSESSSSHQNYQHKS